MRYFLISYSYIDETKTPKFGMLWLSSLKFPSYTEIKETDNLDETIVISIFEFKSKQDFDSFRNE